MEKMKPFINRQTVLYGFFVLILLTGSFLLFQRYPVRDTAAVVGDKKITTSQYEDFKNKCKSYAEFSQDDQLLKDCNQQSLDMLIELKALETEAQKYNVNVSQQEIESKYQEKAKAYGVDAASFDELVSSNIGWDVTTVKQEIKRELLKENLAKYLISSKSVLGIFVRWDILDNSSSQEQINQNIIKAKSYMDKLKPALTADITADQIVQKTENFRKTLTDQWSKDYNISLISVSNINEKTASERFAGKEDWQGIKLLKSVGDTTDVIKSSGGYYVAYKLSSTGKGKFNDWDEFLKNAKQESKIYALSYQAYVAEKKISSFISSALKKTEEKAIALVGAKKAIAGCEQTASCNCATRTTTNGQMTLVHYSQMYGWLKDYVTGFRINGAKVEAWVEDPAINWGTYPACSVRESNYGSYLTNAGGGNGGGHILIGSYADQNLKLLSCFSRWKVSISKNGYDTFTWRNRSVAGNGWSGHIDHIKMGGEYYEGDQALQFENFNEDGYVSLKAIYNRTIDMDCAQNLAGNNSIPVKYMLPSGTSANIYYKKTSVGNYNYFQAVLGNGQWRSVNVSPLSQNTSYDFKLTYTGKPDIVKTCQTTFSPPPPIISTGTCSLSIVPTKGVSPLKVGVSVNPAHLPSRAIDHTHCACQYCACPYDVYNNYTYKSYRLYYVDPQGVETDIAKRTDTSNSSGSANATGVNIPSAFEYTFNKALNPNEKYVIKFSYTYHKDTDDGHDELDYGPYTCGDAATTGVRAVKDSDRLIIEVMP
ncbi:hypothetical protein AUK11_04155 [bacterium CG2_30_37_16]|nr:MAG: hypothetical protein AUK11_04155 [bacterium CG2_30_37_16]PIP30194.1 MAG: hypothetical protein COX25_05955 [bacterium (Candidatus Howlettbacteria) CG23_combo_of_CG06-09_8_20_14_all_37_9]PIX99140.1 MAG: hypothetical protein COZ22_03305 [bacterium (Candidatus Howlettbacteria) CG_4_10_14_3_um_filter_37_10]PJB07047.1 MAG: hypothetical protein CO123_00825 [bacterium (Candidatus Howlettbacteria) CG_4_9_14_3_um_filter_37_10]